jgi:hypothetical protein
LHRHAQAVGCARHAAFVRNDPEIVQVPVAEALFHIQVFVNGLF